MTIDWSQPDMAYLRSQLAKGRVVLFAGAGFAVEAQNRQGHNLPAGPKLAEMLATEAGFEFESEPLAIVYDAAKKMMGSTSVRDALREWLGVESYPDWYDTLGRFIWHRIYTTNLDDLFQQLYRHPEAQQRLETIVNPDNHRERDPHFERLQCVHLHGHIDHGTDPTFTPTDFARITARPNPWYQEFVNDLYGHPCVFIGAQLEEPQLFHYLEHRDIREQGTKELRPKSYLVLPTISKIREKNLVGRNIVPIRCKAREFFESLVDAVDLNDFGLEPVRAEAFPHIRFEDAKASARQVIAHFDHILPDALPPSPDKSDPRLFFLGAEPSWDNIRLNHDGARKITTDLVANLLKASTDQFSCHVLHGPAGSGKTTTLKRVARELSAAGKTVFYSKGAERIDFDGLVSIAEGDDGKHIYAFIDNCAFHAGSLSAFRTELLGSRITLVVCDRSNTYFSKCKTIHGFNPVEHGIGDLRRDDIASIIDRLDEHGFLGELQGMSRPRQEEVFLSKASRQLLVAMREATSGRGFQVIVANEYESLAPEAQRLYLVACLAVSQGAPGVFQRHLLPCAGPTSISTAWILEKLLREVLVPANSSGQLLKPRHRLIAQWVATEVAAPEDKLECIERLLVQVSGDITPNEIRRRSPAYLAYRGLINSEGLSQLLNGDNHSVIGLYDRVRPCYDGDFLFWLQYGMAHIRAGNLDIAENFLNQSLGIRPNSHQTLHHMGMLCLMQAIEADQPGAAADRAQEGMDLLADQIQRRGHEDSYPYVAYLQYVTKWYVHAGELITPAEWEELRAVARQARSDYARDDMVVEAAQEVEKQYMMRAVKEKDRE